MSTEEESIVTFGAGQALVGILSQPAPDAARQQVGCLLLNTGVNHRIGPRRMNVKLARRLAASGLPCLRFDMSGVGDSRPSTGTQDFRTQQLIDMRAALDQFQASTGLSRFLVYGVCSGAASAMRLAVADPRIVGALMFDGYVFLNPAQRVERRLRRMLAFPFNPSLRHLNPAWQACAAWLRAPRRMLAQRRAAPRDDASGPGDAADIFSADAPAYTAQDFAAELQLLVDRGVDVNLMYSAMLHVVDRDKDMLAQLRGHPSLARVRYRFWPEVDHTVTLLESQRLLLDAVDDWARAVAPAMRPLPAPAAHSPARAVREPAQA